MAHDAAEGRAHTRRTRICTAYSRFPSLKKQASFRQVYRKGRRIRGEKLHLFILNTEEKGIRLGISVSKKNGNSVGRHRFARLVKEVFRLHRGALKEGCDIVVAADRTYRIGSGKEISYPETEEQLLWLLCKANILRK